MAETEDPAERLLADIPLEAIVGDATGDIGQKKLLLLEAGSGYVVERLAARLAQRIVGGGLELVVHNSEHPRHVAAQGRAQSAAAARGVAIRCLLGDLPRASGSGRAGEAWPDALEFPAESFDAVLYRLGKGTAALHAAVREAWSLLRPGGSLFISGHTREGVKSLAKRAEEHFGNAELLTLKSSCRLLRFEKAGTAPTTPLPDPDYFAPVELTLEIPGAAPLAYVSKPGIFSYRATDAGTALLARHLEGAAGLRVLDLCCGCGILSLAALRLGAREVTAVDSSAAAVSAARRNLAGSAAPVRILCTDLAAGVEGEFDLILSNPPFHQGAQTDFGLPGRILDAALPHLAENGRLLLVANQFLDYPAQAHGRFSKCETLAQEKGYRVLRLLR